MTYNASLFYVDFSKKTTLTEEEKSALERIQMTYRPIERAEFLNEYRIMGKITSDEFEICTGIPYNFGQ